MARAEVLRPSTDRELSDWLRTRPRDAAPAVTGAELASGIESSLVEADSSLSIVSASSFSEVHSFRPRDLTIDVGAGIRMRELAQFVEREGLWIPAAGIGVNRSVGGWVSAASPAAWDASYGPVRRQLLACRVITPAGDELTWGRAVMKNVAGYDLPRLVVGSRGRLGVLTRVTLRLWPRPEAVTAWRISGGIDTAAFGSEQADAVTWGWRRAEGEHGTAWFAGSANTVRRRQRSLAMRARDAGCEVSEAAPEQESDIGLPARLPGSAVYRLTPGRRYLSNTYRKLVSCGHPRLAAIEAIPESGTLLAFFDPDPAGSHSERELHELSVSSVDRVTTRTDRAPEIGIERAGRSGHEQVDALRATETRMIEGRLERALGAWSRVWQADYL